MERHETIALADTLPRCLGWDGANWDGIQFVDAVEPLATSMPIGAVARLALGAVGMAAATIARARSVPMGPISIDTQSAALAMCANDYLGLNGAPPASWPELTRFYRAADGWVFLHAGFEPQKRRLLAALDAPDDRDALAEKLATMSTQDIEDRCLATNTCGRRLRTPSEWRDHPAGQEIAAQPVLIYRPLASNSGHAWTPAKRPLDGIRVLDLSRVLAGPTIGRTLAEHGAEVLRIAGPNIPFIEPLVIDTGYGKRAANVDLETPEGLDDLSRLITQADVFIDGYRPGALDRHGLDRKTLRALNPGLVHLSLSAFGETGPWAGMRGYDSLVQAAVGLSGGEPPKRLPCQPLDYLAGYLGAFAVMRALIGRAEFGTGAEIELSLAGMAHWLVSMADKIGPAAGAPDKNPTPDDVADQITALDTVFGRVTSLRPALDVPWRPRDWAPPVRLGTHAPEWLDRS